MPRCNSLVLNLLAVIAVVAAFVIPVQSQTFYGAMVGTVTDASGSAMPEANIALTNNSTGDVCFARSYNFSTMGVWTSGTTNATFDIPSSCEKGASTLQAVVNGIASVGTSVTLN